MDISFENEGKLCSRYNFCNRQSKPWVVKKGGNIGYIGHSTGRILGSIRSSLLLLDSLGAAIKLEEAWVVN